MGSGGWQPVYLPTGTRLIGVGAPMPPHPGVRVEEPFVVHGLVDCRASADQREVWLFVLKAGDELPLAPAEAIPRYLGHFDAPLSPSLAAVGVFRWHVFGPVTPPPEVEEPPPADPTPAEA
jgi:hypothetical protein